MNKHNAGTRGGDYTSYKLEKSEIFWGIFVVI